MSFKAIFINCGRVFSIFVLMSAQLSGLIGYSGLQTETVTAASSASLATDLSPPAPNSISATDHEGQLSPSGTWTNGNVTEYSEGDFINFRATITSSSDADGNFKIIYDSLGNSCTFFTSHFAITNTENISGDLPVVTAVGAPVLVSGSWEQEVFVDFANAGQARLNYQLELSDDAGACSGSSTHTSLGNSANGGDFSNIGAQVVSVPAKDIIVLPDITITKLVDEDGDGIGERTALANEWQFTLDGSSPAATDSNGQVVFANVPDGAHTIAESTVSNYILIEVSGDCTMTSPTKASLTVVATTNTPNQECTFVNQLDNTTNIKLVKNVINDHGGPLSSDDFTLLLNGVATDQDTYIEYPAGIEYTVSENEIGGYEKVSIVCVDDNSLATLTNPFTPNPGQDVTCTVTNDDLPATITLVKDVDNNSGGQLTASDFDLFVGGQSVSSGVENTVDPGTYAINENQETGYKFVDITGDGCPAALGGTVTVANGDDIVCTITNEDIAPLLTIIKSVINDNGGLLSESLFPLFVGNTSVANGVQYNTFLVGPYAVSETQQDGYSFTGFSGDCDASGNVTLELDGIYTCTLTNNDQPATVTVVKEIVNDEGDAVVADFSLFVNSGQVLSGESNDYDAQVEINISESTTITGYEQTSLVCDDVTNPQNIVEDIGMPFTAELGHDYRCTIVNDDLPASVKVFKEVTNNYDGPLGSSDFQLTLNGQNVDQNEATPVFIDTEYTVSEIEDDQYTFEGVECYETNSQAQITHPFTPQLGQNIECTVSNSDKPATLTVVKRVTNDNGGNADAEDFELFVNWQSVDSSQTNEYAAGTYQVSEAFKLGYFNTGYDGDCDSSGNVTLVNGQDYTCYVDNDDIPAYVIVDKAVINDDGGQLESEDFQLTLNDENIEQGTILEIDANADYTVGELAINGYTQTSVTYTSENHNELCATDFEYYVLMDSSLNTDVSHRVLAPTPTSSSTFEALPCMLYRVTITNDDIPAEVTVIKEVVNDNGLNLTPADFDLSLNDTAVASGQTVKVAANTEYTVSEAAVANYVQTSLVCTDTLTKEPLGNPFTPVNGQSVECIVTNDDDPKITVVLQETLQETGIGALGPQFAGLLMIGLGGSLSVRRRNRI